MSSVGNTILYSFWKSSCTWRVRIALNYKEIPHEIKTINLLKPVDQLIEEYKEINPLGQIPALRIDGITLIESLNIIHYLEETRPEKPLMPKDFAKRAKVREISEIIASGIQPFQNLSVHNRLVEENKEEWTRFWIRRGFNAVEKLLSSSSGRYSVGDTITMADCCIIPQVYHARGRFKLDLTPYTNIVRIDKELEDHPAFKAAHPDNQPDFRPKKKTFS